MDKPRRSEKHILAIVSNIPEKKTYVIFFLDATRHLLAEDALWESEERFRTIFEETAIGMSLVYPLEGRILMSNPAMQNMLGYTAKELTGMQFAEFTHPENIDGSVDPIPGYGGGQV